MHVVMSNALARGWHDFRLLLGDFTVSGAVWLLIGLLATAALSAVAMDAALALHAPQRRQSRAKWPPGGREIDDFGAASGGHSETQANGTQASTSVSLS